MKQTNNHNIRSGACIEHGEAHQKDHAAWSRRQFLTTTGLFAMGSAFMLGSSRVQALSQMSKMQQLLSAADNDRVLVIVFMNGGNDGLNTIVPRFNNTYYNLRPTLAVPESGLFPLDSAFGMPNTMLNLQPLWQDGKMAVVHSVSYPQQDYSHFRSADIWSTGSASNTYLETGWLGRYLDYEYPSYNTAPAEFPIAIQVGVQSSMVFMGATNPLGLTINNPNEFYQIAQTGQLYPTDNMPDCSYGEEMLFLRQMANNTVRYAQTIKVAYDNAAFGGSYPDNYLAAQLAVTARLIKGGLQTKIYLVEIGGFDTHADQAVYHPELMTRLAGSIRAFYDDLTNAGQDERVLTMTFSEFGRTIGENGSFGTDHGQAAPMLFFGGSTVGGMKGTFGALSEDEGSGDQSFTTDYRTVYSSVLKDWFCINDTVVNNIMGGNFGIVPNLLADCMPQVGSSNLAVLLGHNPSPTQSGIILIKYALLFKGGVKLQILDTSGQPRATIVNATQDANSYTIPFNPASYGLAPGEYFYRLETGGKSYMRRIMI